MFVPTQGSLVSKLFIGLGIFAVPVGLIASALTKTTTKDDKEGKE
jgi:hypothetical protein